MVCPRRLLCRKPQSAIFALLRLSFCTGMLYYVKRSNLMINHRPNEWTFLLPGKCLNWGLRSRINPLYKLAVGRLKYQKITTITTTHQVFTA